MYQLVYNSNAAYIGNGNHKYEVFGGMNVNGRKV